jgi:C4-dicarboxylate-binding protein DctP
MRRIPLVMLLFAAGCLISGTVWAAPPIVMKCTVATPEHHFETKQFIEWGRLTEQNSKGEIKFQLYHSAQLFRDNEAVKAIQTGGVESGAAFAMYMQNQLVPAMKVLQAPFLFNTLEEALKVIHSDIGDGWRKVAEQKGVRLFGLVSFPSPEGEGLCTIKPAKVPADVKGMVLRTIGPELATMMKKWGAGPSFLTGAEVYMALQRGTLHGGIASVATYVERKFYEVAPHLVMLPYASVHVYIAVNKGFFDRLTPFQQKAILDASDAIDKSNYNVAMTTMKRDMEEGKQKAKIYFPSAAELAKWSEGREDVWAEMSKASKDVGDSLTKVRAMLKR